MWRVALAVGAIAIATTGTAASQSPSATVDGVLKLTAAADEAGEKLFTTKQVRLQALNEADGTWEDIEDLGSSSGYVGEADGIKPGYEVDIDLRLKVEASAPVGAGFSLGGGLVFGDTFDRTVDHRGLIDPHV